MSTLENTNFGVYTPSSNRPENVENVTKTFAPYEVTWLVPEGQGESYEKTGATSVIEVATPEGERPLPVARNAALNHAFERELICIQSDDDPKKLQTYDFATGKAKEGTFTDYVRVLSEGMRKTGARLAGCAPTPNAYFSKGEIKTTHFICAHIFATKPTDLRFDVMAAVREDYEYTCQHISRYGLVARCDELLPTYAHWTNKGGCQDYRSDELDVQVNEMLIARWPDLLRHHPKRKNELILRHRAAR